MISAQPNTLITLSYNSRRQRSMLSDPNYGLMQTTYNAFGELINQTTPRGFETTYTYDKLGRTTSRVEHEGTTTWHYNTTPGLLGTLERIEGTSHSTIYTYDALLRPETVTENINNQDYTTAYTYDHFGRPETITHPSGFAEQNTYNNYGYLKKISNANDQSPLWEAQAYYAPGMLYQSATGNGLVTRSLYEPETLRLTGSFVYNAAQERVQDFEYTYDKLGNMRHRIKWLNRDENTFLKEEFWYDNLNRLTDIKLNGQPTGGHDYDPEGLGNITAKTANGQQIYSNAEYGEGNHGPHAISSAITTGNVFPADPQTAEYTSFEQLYELRQGDKTLFINYGHHHQRISQRYLKQYHVTLKQWAGACEYITRNGQTTTLTYLSGPGGLYALHLINPDESESLRYLHTDHLGSWTAVTDETGEVVDEQSYDAWGNRRNDSTWTNIGELQPPLFDRGFTGHEHLDGFQLINMNGRMYDPVVSRMLAPDNFVQTPDFSQNFNRYSYCFNNPLIYTDPDGEIAFLAIIAIGAAVFGTTNLAVQAANGEIDNFWDGAKAFGAGAIAGAAITAGVTAGLGVPILGTVIKGAGIVYGGTTALSAVSGLGEGIFTGDWSRLENTGKIFAGNFYLDSDRNLFGQAWQGISRYSWELTQSTIGHGLSQLRNTFGAVDRVDYFGGATFSTDVNPNASSVWGISLGNHIGIQRTDDSFDVLNDPLLMHEYGHTFDSQIFGLSYLLAIGIPSASGAEWTEHRANRHAERYFGNRFGVNWTPYLGGYPLNK